MRRRPIEVRSRFRRALLTRATIALSTIALFELWFGIARSERPIENTERLQLFLAGGISVLPFESEDAEIAGDLRAALERAGTPIGHCDVLIAAHTIRLGATLVTANGRAFVRVPGLTWEDWAA